MSGSVPDETETAALPPEPETAFAAPADQEHAGLIVVAIGASAGGLDACRAFVRSLPPTTGMAFIVVQHLDPAHVSMMADLLTGHSHLAVSQATDGELIEPEHLYVIPPAMTLWVRGGALHLTRRAAPHGLRLPFDILLHSMAEEYGPRAACIVLSGTGSDGSLGLQSIRAKHGLVLVQDPSEAGYAGMPRSAIDTGMADSVLPVAEMPGALVQFRQNGSISAKPAITDRSTLAEVLPAIIDLLRSRTSHDFTLYKQGTLLRRIERRMAQAGLKPNQGERYIEVLGVDVTEVDLLAKELLINVTSFFRDPQVFDYLAKHIIPELVSHASQDRPLRIWVAGCSTGEETYSLAMLFREALTAANLNIKLQVFGSDVDPDAIAVAREGFYAESIAASVSASRLARFFSKEERGYRIAPELRALVVFTVQDVLADPPFSRLDLVSCRNLLIYLGGLAQAKVLSLFHFALRESGILLLGGSETVGSSDGLFEIISKPERLYRHVGNKRGGLTGMTAGRGPFLVPVRQHPLPVPTRHFEFAELCRRLVLENFAPAAVLVDQKNQCLYTLGRTDRFLTLAPGHPSLDVLAMARPGVRTKLRAAIQQAAQDKARATIHGGRIEDSEDGATFSIDVRPIANSGEALYLVCFIEDAPNDRRSDRRASPRDLPKIAQLELELMGTRSELQSAIRNLELSAEEQKVINEEVLSFNEEYQSTNEELMTSKEEMQSMNEELTALNGQLQETLERQRTTSNDLKNVLYSTDVATLFLDTHLNIRFFTPATRHLFRVIPSDIGRPLADLQPLAVDSALLEDARIVLGGAASIDREIETEGGDWYLRRILPYRTQENGIEGVVITFADITESRRAADALVSAKAIADIANAAKSRFLAAASHDLRQPLQTLVLIQGLLAKSVADEKQQRLVARLQDTLGAMSGMLNTLLDINQIDAGVVRASPVDVPIGDLIERIMGEFAYVAQASDLELHSVYSSAIIRTDPDLLEQIIRNLVANALKYTNTGKVLIGCRRLNRRFFIEVWDTGVGIPAHELQAIFEEYHQLDNMARDQSRGLGLGLSIVRRLSHLLGHSVTVRSRPGKGSVFAVEVSLSPLTAGTFAQLSPRSGAKPELPALKLTGSVLIVEDDQQLRGLLEMFLTGEGYSVMAAHDGQSAMAVLASGKFHPDLLLADYNLPNGMHGLEVAAQIRGLAGATLPAIILTGDISADTLRRIALGNCVQLHKPVKLDELTRSIQSLLSPDRVMPPAAEMPAREFVQKFSGPTIFVVDDDMRVRDAVRATFEERGHSVECFETSEEFLARYTQGREGCLLVDACLPGMSGLELLQRLSADGHRLPSIMITGYSDVSMAVRAMKAGASDFIEKPIGTNELVASVERALAQAHDSSIVFSRREQAAKHVANLTPRQREIMTLVLAGHPSKNIAADLGISQRTVENHRASIMKKTGSKSLPALARLALAASVEEDSGGRGS